MLSRKNVNALTEYSYGMHRLDALQHLLRETLEVSVIEWLLAMNDPMKVAVHELRKLTSKQANRVIFV